MLTKFLIVVVSLNTVISHLLLKRAIQAIGGPSTHESFPNFVFSAALSPWVWASLTLQIFGYVAWMVVISNEKLGVATASVGASYYILTATAAWLVFGENLGALQWVGILLITAGVVCVSLGSTAS